MSECPSVFVSPCHCFLFQIAIMEMLKDNASYHHMRLPFHLTPLEMSIKDLGTIAKRLNRKEKETHNGDI